METIEAADNKGDTKTIYRGVKALGGSAAFERTKPTERITKKRKNLKTTNEIRSKTANGETETKILDEESQTANQNTAPPVTDAETATANENAPFQPTTCSQWPAESQPGGALATNDKTESTVTETKIGTTNETEENKAANRSEEADDQVGSKTWTNEKTVTENLPATKAPRPEARGQPGSRISSPQELARV